MRKSKANDVACQPQDNRKTGASEVERAYDPDLGSSVTYEEVAAKLAGVPMPKFPVIQGTPH